MTEITTYKCDYCRQEFDDCACCPLMFKCRDDEDIQGIDCIECGKKIIDWLKENEE